MEIKLKILSVRKVKSYENGIVPYFKTYSLKKYWESEKKIIGKVWETCQFGKVASMYPHIQFKKGHQSNANHVSNLLIKRLNLSFI